MYVRQWIPGTQRSGAGRVRDDNDEADRDAKALNLDVELSPWEEEHMADTVHLYLKLNGVDIQGESTQTSLGRTNSIECSSLSFDVEAGGHVRGEIKVAARIDKATPLVVKGLVEKQTADAVFKFFRPNPTGDGTTEQFFTITGKNGHVSSAQMWVPDTLNPASSNLPPIMRYAFSFESIEETYTPNGVTFGWTP